MLNVCLVIFLVKRFVYNFSNSFSTAVYNNNMILCKRGNKYIILSTHFMYGHMSQYRYNVIYQYKIYYRARASEIVYKGRDFGLVNHLLCQPVIIIIMQYNNNNITGWPDDDEMLR